MAVSGGMYELRYANATGMAVDVNGASATKGANVQLYAANDGNNQRFVLTEESEGRWSLRSVASGLYVDVDGARAASGTNVQQWTANGGRAQRWRLVETGDTVEIEGYECAVVKLGSYVTEDADTYYLDVNGAMTTNRTNVQIWTKNGTDAQVFALLPTTKLDSGFPAPADVGWTHDMDSVRPYGTVANPARTSMWLGWRMPSTWVPTAALERAYQRRVRSRRMDATTSAWGEWSGWSRWGTAASAARGEWCLDGSAVDPSFDTSGHKAVEFQVQVRCASLDEGGAWSHGPAATGTTRNIVDPTATLSLDHVAADGLHVSVASDYCPATYTLASMLDGATELLAEPVSTQVLSSPGELVVPWSSLKSIPEDGAEVAVTYTRGTDLFATISGTKSGAFTIDYGDAPETAPTLTQSAGRMLDVTHPDGVSGVWVSNGDGVWGDGDGRSVLYPFGSTCRTLVLLKDGTVWLTDLDGIDVVSCHAFNWDGGSLLVECDTSPLVTSRAIKMDYEAMSLNARKWQSVSYMETASSEYTVTGVLLDDVSESVVDDLLDMLLDERHVTYRSPHGEVAEVAVVGASYKTHYGYTEVSIDMIEETR